MFSTIFGICNVSGYTFRPVNPTILRFKQDYQGYKKGDTAIFVPTGAEKLIKSGVAVEIKSRKVKTA